MSAEPSREIALPTPWDKRKGESRQAFHNFSIYRDLGPGRSLAKAATALGKSSRTLEEQSQKYDWVARAEAYDLHLDQRALREREEAIRDHERRTLQAGQAMAGAAVIAMTGRRAGVRDNGEIVEPVEPVRPESAADVARWLEVGTRTSRLVLGLPTDLSKSMDSVTMREVVEFGQYLVEGALARMPESEQEGYLVYVRAYKLGGRRD